jgi:hypothetical protein
MSDSSNADPDPNPNSNLSDPYVFWPPGSGSGLFCHRAKILGRTLISTALILLFYFLSLENNESKSNQQKTSSLYFTALYGYLLLQQCCGSMTFWCVSGPDPVIYVIEQKTSYFFKRIFSLLFFEGTFASFFGDKESKTMTKL